MKIGRADVEYVARLAHLECGEAELDTFTRQLDDILTYMEKLNRLDTAGIVPTSHAIPIPNPMREDETHPSGTADDILAGAPERSDRFFRVPKVIE